MQKQQKPHTMIPKKKKKKVIEDDNLFPESVTNPIMPDSNSDLSLAESDDSSSDILPDDYSHDEFDGFDGGTSDGGGASGDY